MDQIREEPEMAAFVDTLGQELAANLDDIRRTLQVITDRLEKDAAGAYYQRAWRFALAAEAAIEHTIAELKIAGAARHGDWQRRQRDAHTFLELRAKDSGRRFLVKDHPGERYRGLPLPGTSFMFSFQRTAALDGRQHALVCQLEAGPDQKPSEMTLQQLHRAFERGAVFEITDDAIAAANRDASTQPLDARAHAGDGMTAIGELLPFRGGGDRG